MKQAFTLFPPNPTYIFFARSHPYTLRRETLHDEGFCVEFTDQTIHIYHYDYQDLNPNCVGFEGNACTLEKRIGLKGENARLAREAYFIFFPVFLFEGIMAQVLLSAPTRSRRCVKIFVLTHRLPTKKTAEASSFRNAISRQSQSDAVRCSEQSGDSCSETRKWSSVRPSDYVPRRKE